MENIPSSESIKHIYARLHCAICVGWIQPTILIWLQYTKIWEPFLKKKKKKSLSLGFRE